MCIGGATVEGSARAAFREMRRLRRRRYVDRLELMEVLYRLYLGAIFGAIALGVLAGAINEAPADPAAIDWLRGNGPALAGLALACGALAGLRAGARGGPLAIEAAEVQYVLLAPLDRGVALRPSAWRQLRIGALVGAVAGAVVGNFVFRRFPGSALEWILCLALFGALVPVSVLGAALLASGRRLRAISAGLIGLLLAGWCAADLALGSTSSPLTMLGALATLPLQGGAWVGLAAAGAAIVLALTGVGLFGVGGILLEAARRRAALAAELRFSASVQDLRTVVLLRRQLASERPRRRPWLRLPVAPRHPVWRRGWQSFLRWPLARLLRAILLGAAAGALAAAAWSDAPPALFLPGLLLFVVALDFVEPLAQESDHPTRRRLLPLEAASLIGRHLAAPALAIAAVLLVAVVAAAALGASGSALGAGLVVLAPVALGLAVCAAFSATADPYAYILAPEIGYAISTAPVAAAALLVGMPLFAAREAERQGSSAASVAVGIAVTLALLTAAAVPALGHRFRQRDGGVPG
jgi:hypothetical protein